MNIMIKPSCFNEYQKITFYLGENQISVDRLNGRENIQIPDNWQNLVKDYKYDATGYQGANGIIFDADDFHVRNARKLNLDKNDIFTIKEYNECNRENERVLYVPAAVSLVGTEKRMETKFGYYLYNKFKVCHPINVTVWLREEISKEKADEYMATWGDKRYKEKPGIIHEIRHRESYRGKPGAWLLFHYIDIISPCFYVFSFKENVTNEYYDKTAALAAKMNEAVKSKSFSHYDIDRLLEHFDIVEKEEA